MVNMELLSKTLAHGRSRYIGMLYSDTHFMVSTVLPLQPSGRILGDRVMQYFILLMAWTPKPAYLGLNLPVSVTSSTTYLLVTLGKNLIFEGQCSLISVNKKKWISEIPNKS